jgi:hypothetical protein
VILNPYESSGVIRHKRLDDGLGQLPARAACDLLVGATVRFVGFQPRLCLTCYPAVATVAGSATTERGDTP